MNDLHFSKNPLHYVHALGVLLLFLGFMLFNNSLTVWQQNQQLLSSSTESYSTVDERREAHKAIQLRLALHLASSLFLLVLGANILAKRRWACHFFCSVNQLARLALVLIPLSTVLFLHNRPLIESLSRLYLPIIQELMQQQDQTADVPDVNLLFKVIHTTFWIVAMLGLALASIALRLSNRCLQSEVQQALLVHSVPARRWSLFLLCLPPRMLLVFVLAVYGTVLQLLETILIVSEKDTLLFALLLSLGAFVAFAFSLLHLVNRNMQEQAEALPKEVDAKRETQRERDGNSEYPDLETEPAEPAKPEETGEINTPKGELKWPGSKQSTPGEPPKHRLLQKAIQFCGVAYLLQLLQSTVLPLWQSKNDWAAQGEAIAESLNIAALQTTMNQIASLGNLAVLLLLGWLYYRQKQD